MCGLIGFFVGCDLAIACPKRNLCTSSRPYRSSFYNWDSRASVRNAPRRMDQVNSALFPERFLPVFKHNLVQVLDGNSRELLRKAGLYRFLNFTHKLEILVVNTVTANIALGRYNTGFSDDVRLDAHRIYVDEAYHALFSFELMQEIKAGNVKSVAFREVSPEFIRRTQELVEGHSPGDRALLELTVVIVSEMLISNTLREAWAAPDIDQGVSAMIKDHARDEARHHAFYRHVLLDLWPRLSDHQRNLVLEHIHPFLMAYTAPDNRAIRSELRAVGLTDNQAHEVFADIYDPQTISGYAADCGKEILSTFEELVHPLDFERMSEHFLMPPHLEKVGKDD